LLDKEVEDAADDVGGAVTGDFYGVFACVAVWGAEDGDEGFVDEFSMRGNRIAL
jgi:hypothetical protein